MTLSSSQAQKSSFPLEKNERLSSERVFLHFSEDPFFPFTDLLPSITVRLLPGDLFLMN